MLCGQPQLRNMILNGSQGNVQHLAKLGRLMKWIEPPKGLDVLRIIQSGGATATFCA